MSKATDNLNAAQKLALETRPKVGGFPYLAEILRRAGASRNIWYLPSCQSTYYTSEGSVVTQNTPLVTGTADIPRFDKEALVKALRTNQAGNSTFPEFLEAAWRAGTVRYEVNFKIRKVTYYGINEEAYVEEYPAVEIK